MKQKRKGKKLQARIADFEKVKNNKGYKRPGSGKK